ncbi:MAG: hypothetical protein ACUVS4_03780 [Chloroflexaceae bacterium]
MHPKPSYALAGAALFNPMAAMFWLDVVRGRKPSVGLALVGAAGAACAALAAPRGKVGQAIGAGALAAASAALAGLVLERYVAWIERQDPEPRPPAAQALLVPAAAACGAAMGAVALAGRHATEYAPYSGKAGDYRWISADPHPAARPSAWTGYLLHQFGIWGCVYAAQRARLSYAEGMRAVNWIALGVNAAGVILHVLQTRHSYDGLALDVPEGTSLGSVSFMLMLILVLEAPRRGLVMGLRRLKLPPELVRFVRRYHGYIFSWATVYTFWYHPMEPLPSHLGGLYHMLLLFVQSSLLFTDAHRDPRWTLALEMLAMPHAVITTLQKRSGLERMFIFGFLGMFVLSQMHGLGLSRRARLGLGASYAAAALAWYGSRREWRRLPDVLRIPILEYGIVGFLVLLTLILRLLRRPLSRVEVV